MKVKVLSSELGRMMRILSGCIEKIGTNSNIEISHNNNLFSIRAISNGQFVQMSTPLLGGDGETFCVDGKMFANIVSRASADVEIATDERNCYVKSNWRTRIPLVDVSLVKPPEVHGSTVTITAESFTNVADSVRYAASTEETRPILTGILTNVSNGQMTMVAVDGFQMAVESAACEGDDINIVIPNTMLKRICDCAGPEESITITTDGARVRLHTDSADIVGGVLHGDFIDYQKIMPTAFSTKVLVNISELANALKGSSVVGNVKNLVKFIVSNDHITITSNSEQADFECDIPCDTHGGELSIAFNDKYVLNALTAINSDEAVLHFNNPISPAIFTEKSVDNAHTGIHLVLPVRVK